MEAGKILKQAREKKNLSLHEIGMSLKINPKTLQAIEEGDLAKLPPKTFLRGFIKSYAQFLKLDPVQVLAADETKAAPVTLINSAPVTEVQTQEKVVPLTPAEEMPKPVRIAQEPQPLAPKAEESSASQRATKLDNLRTQAPGPQKGFYLMLIIALVLIIGSVYGQVKKYQRDSVVHKTELSTDASGVAVTKDSGLSEEKKPEATSPGVKASNENTAPIAPPATPASNSVAATPAPLETKTPEITKTPEPVAPLAAVDNAAAKKLPENVDPVIKPQEVILEALNNVHIVFSLGDGKVEALDLSADEIHTFKSGSLIHLEISDGGSVNLIVNGRERGVPGKIGKPLVLTYPK